MPKSVKARAVEGKRWDQLAYEAYGDPLAYERIFRANPAFGVSLFLPAGAELRVPVLEADEAAAEALARDLPPWKREA